MLSRCRIEGVEKRQHIGRSDTDSVASARDEPELQAGGGIVGGEELYRVLRQVSANKPVAATISGTGASAAYMIALAADRVFVRENSITGSIGVIMQFTNLEKLYDWAKVSRYSIKTGKFKDAGAEYRPMTAEERSLLQAMVDDTLSQFKAAVAEGRRLSRREVDAVADGTASVNGRDQADAFSTGRAGFTVATSSCGLPSPSSGTPFRLMPPDLWPRE